MRNNSCLGPVRRAFALAATIGLLGGAARADMLDNLHVPEGFVVDRVAGPPLTSYPMFMAFDDRGGLFIAESSGLDLSGTEMAAEPGCVILRLEDSDDDGVYDRRTVFAEGLSLPMGVLWHDGALFVASPPDFLRLDDTDGDGVADRRTVLLTGWNILNTASLHGPFLGPDGWLYLTHGRHGFKIDTKEGTTLEGLAARIWRCRPDGTGLEAFCGGGFDNPIEMVFTEGGDPLGTMTYFTDPRNGQRDGLMHWVEGGVYPKPHDALKEFTRTGPLLPTMTKFSRIAPSGLARLSGVGLGAKFSGDLFSAQFNPSRVQRHRLFRDGDTYRTEDSDFLTSASADFHPTDVLEDIDGSLLVSDTGAWYVDACPISRVARPEIRGGIYRIRREDIPRQKNLWAVPRALATATPDALAAALADPRPLVHESAREHLVRGGGANASALRAVLEDPEAPSRQSSGALWAYSRIQPPQEAETIYAALRHRDPDTRQAAARALGMRNDPDAGMHLAHALVDIDPAVQREAAISLGRLRAMEVAPFMASISSVAFERFPFLEHAFVWALIQLRADTVLAEGFDQAPPPAKRAALVALDQMGSPLLEARHALALLASQHPALRETALWVASHHPEWSGDILAFVGERLRPGAEETTLDAALRDVLLAYAHTAEAQSLVAQLLRDTPSAARRDLLLGILRDARIEPLPESWRETLAALLDDTEAAARWGAIGVIRTRALEGFDERLTALANDTAEDAALRLAALSARLGRVPALGEHEFALLLDQLPPGRPPALRQPAAEAVAKARLTEAQQIALSRETLPGADALTFHALVDALAAGGHPAVGTALVEALRAMPDTAPSLTVDRLDALLGEFPASVREAAAPVRARARAAEAQRFARLEGLAPRIGTGDVGRGRRLFFSERAACHTCHAIGEEGGRFGPDLTTIGVVRSGLDLLEAVLFPSASQVPGYENFRFELRDPEFGGAITEEGLLGGEDADGLLIKTGVDTLLRVPRADLLAMTPHPVSKMPTDLDATLSEDELLDLIAFLQSLNNEHWLLPERRDESN